MAFHKCELNFQILIEKSQLIRRRSNEKYKPDCIVPTIKHPPWIMVWSIISSKYQKVLETQLLLKIKRMVHKTREAYFYAWWSALPSCKKDYNIFNWKIVEILDWTGNCPDLAPSSFWSIKYVEYSYKNKQKLIEILDKLILGNTIGD